MIDVIEFTAQWIGFFVIGLVVFMLGLWVLLIVLAALVDAAWHVVNYFRVRQVLRREYTDRRDILNRRAEVESYLFDCANEKRPLPDKEQCRLLALKLGVPSKWRK